MSKPVTKVRMNGFRGAVGPCELDFDPRKDLSMLFGENGSGKSTILDAIDVVCNDTVGCLDGVSVGRSPGQYLCSLGCQPSTFKVSVYSDTDHWTGSMRRSSVSVSGDGVRPHVKTLRRNCILDLVLAQPSDRYKALQHFIEIGVVEQSEASLQQQLRSVSGEIDSLTRDKLRMSGQLDSLWQAEGRPGPGETAMAWAEGKVATGIGGLDDRLAKLTAFVTAMSAAATARTQYDARFAAHEAAKDGLRQIDDRIADSPGVAPGTAVKLLESLEKARAYIEAEPALDKCPTCQRPLERERLLDIVGHEFASLSELKSLSDQKQATSRQLDVAASHLREARVALIEALRQLQAVASAGEFPEIAELSITWPDWEAGEPSVESLTAICDAVEPARTNLESQRDQAQRDVSQFNSIKEWWTGITEADVKLRELDRVRSGLQRAFDIVHQKRVTFTQAILNDIRQEANRLFEVIHPGENIGLDELKMEVARRGSVSQSGCFHGHTDVPPQAVFSESHLDTLGFCVWLALAKREAPERTVLLIDDIFSSVDSVHLSRIIDLLSQEAPNFLQVIVATHYRLWWDRCQNARGIERIHLGRWCAQNGIAAQSMPLVTQQLRQAAAEPVLDRQAVSSKAGILLESILDDLALLYECSLPRNKFNLYTLGALLSGCGKLFIRHDLTVHVNGNWQVEGEPEDWRPTVARDAFDRVNALQFIRNQVGCHFNPPGLDIPDDDVREFGAATIALVEALVCPNCGSLATKTATDGTHRRCSCKKRAVRMTPVDIQ